MESKYKVGDVVTIKKKRVGSSGDYRFCFIDAMLEDYGGQSYKIKSISSAEELTKELIPDDGYRYFLEGACFSWASSMFEDSSEALSLECAIDNSLDAFIMKKKCPKLDFTL